MDLAPGAGAREPDQLVEVLRVAVGLGRERRGAGRAGVRRAREQLARERGRVVGRQRLEHDRGRAHRERRQPVGPGPRVEAPDQDQQERRRIGRAHQRGQQQRRVVVGPLDVVDREDQRPALAERVDQLAQHREHARAQHLRIDDIDHRRRGQHRHPPQHREHAREQLDPRRHQRRGLDLGHLPQVARERVDEPVAGVERHRLALVAARLQHERPRLDRGDLVDRAPDERGLADARLAHDCARSPPRRGARAPPRPRRLASPRRGGPRTPAAGSTTPTARRPRRPGVATAMGLDRRRCAARDRRRAARDTAGRAPAGRPARSCAAPRSGRRAAWRG